MTTNIRQISEAYQAGISIGRAQAKHEMEELAKLTAAFEESIASPGTQRPGKPVKTIPWSTVTSDRPKATEPRRARKVTGPREKGIKEAIKRLIADKTPSTGVTAADIIAWTGFKPTSVRATLMALRKAGVVSLEGKHWFGSHPIAAGDNSEHASKGMTG